MPRRPRQALSPSSFRRGFAQTFLLDVPSRLLGAATVVVLVRGLTVGSYASYTLFLAIGVLAGSAAGGGVRMRHLRLTAERESRGATDDPPPSFTAALASTTGLLLGLAIVGVAGAEVARAAGAPAPSAVLLLAAGLYGSGIAAGELVIAHLQAVRRFALAGSLGVVRSATLLLIAFTLALTPLGRSPDAVVITFAAGMLALGFGVCAPLIRADGPARRLSRRTLLIGREERSLTVYYVAAAGFAYVDILVAGALLDTRDIATLGATLRYLSLVLGVFPALNTILKVRTSQVDVVDSPLRQRRLLIDWMRRSTPPCVALFAAGILLAPFAIPLIDGGRYPGSVLAFQVYLATALAAYITAPASNVLITQRRAGWLARTLTIALIVNLAGDVLAARRFGIIGIAAVSTALYVLVEGATAMAALSGAAAAPPAPAKRSVAVQ